MFKHCNIFTYTSDCHCSIRQSRLRPVVSVGKRTFRWKWEYFWHDKNQQTDRPGNHRRYLKVQKNTKVRIWQSDIKTNKERLKMIIFTDNIAIYIKDEVDKWKYRLSYEMTGKILKTESATYRKVITVTEG